MSSILEFLVLERDDGAGEEYLLVVAGLRKGSGQGYEGLAGTGPACKGYQLDVRIHDCIHGQGLLVVAGSDAVGGLRPYSDDGLVPVVVAGQGKAFGTVVYLVVLVGRRSAADADLGEGDSFR